MDSAVFLTLDEAIDVHMDLVSRYGGHPGIRDTDLLLSALAMPQASFGGEFLHRDIFEAAAAYAFHICNNRPFVDGNKRTGFMTAMAFLEFNGHEFAATEVEAVLQTLALAAGALDEKGYAAWLRQNSRRPGRVWNRADARPEDWGKEGVGWMPLL